MNQSKNEIVMTISAAPASEHKGVPAWRVLAGNLAAGALAGCTVEAGKHRLHRVESIQQWGAMPNTTM